MVYYRVKKEHDNKTLKNRTLIGNELYTEGEMKKYAIPEKYIVRVELSSKDTYTSFGARFQVGTDYASNL